MSIVVQSYPLVSSSKTKPCQFTPVPFSYIAVNAP